MLNRTFCRIVMFLLPKKLIKRKVKIILTDEKLKIVIPNKGQSAEEFRKSVEKLIEFFE